MSEKISLDSSDIFLFVSYGVSNLRGFLSAEPNQGAYRVVFAPNI